MPACTSAIASRSALGVPDSRPRPGRAVRTLITEPTLAVSLSFEPGEPNAELDGEPVLDRRRQGLSRHHVVDDHLFIA